MVEKRKYIRLKAPIGVTYNLIKKHKRSKAYKSLVRDIGAGGMSLEVSDDLRAGDLLQLEIQIPHLEDPVSAIGEVVWFASLKSAERETLEAGLKFRDIKTGQLHHILEYVHAVGIG